MEGIESKAALRIVEAPQCLHPKPKVGEPIGESVAARGAVGRQFSYAHEQRLRVSGMGLEEQRQVLGKVLTVVINRYGMVVAQFQRLAKALLEGVALAFVGLVFYPLKGERQTVERRRGNVGTAIVDHYDVGCEAMYPRNDVGYGGGVVIRRNDDTYFVHA